ncbi:saccharopine dehydrogenase [Pseudonocardia sp. CA-107938]|uniref:saccharopine dehydrogenase n=1 Tax=Pseudonocardia sp. CA-107938 TaxID=3240021 RepID=UPI003D8ED1C4
MDRMKPVLILGGTGQAGRDTAEMLRTWHPELPLAIAGRDIDRARRVADGLGGATATTVDLQRADLGLPAGGHSAVVAALWDSRHTGLRYAQDQGIPYVSISSGYLDVAPEIVVAAQRPGAAPVLLASHFCTGTVVLAVAHLARELARVDAVRVGAIMDEEDSGGPAGLADLERWATVTSAGLQRRDGVFTWVDETAVQVPASDGVLVDGASVAVLDVPSIAAATGAPDVRVDLAIGESAGRRAGGAPSVEVLVEIDGVDAAGQPRRISRYLVHRAGQRPLTALGIALGVERLIGLQGDPVGPGIHMPESLIDPAHAAARLAGVGAEFVDVPALTAR